MTDKREYPASFKPDSNSWFVRAAWALLDDNIEPGALPRDLRFLLAGLIAGALSEVYKLGQERGDPNKRWPKP